MVFQRGELRNVERQGRLAHARATGDHDQIASLQARRLLVQVAETSRHAGDAVLALAEFLQPVPGIGEQFPDRFDGAPAQSPVGDLEDALFSPVKEFNNLASLEFEGIRGNIAPDLNESPQQGAVAHDLRVSLDVGGPSGIAHQSCQVGTPTGILQLSVSCQVLSDRDGIRVLSLLRDLRDRLEDELVILAVQLARGQRVGHLIPGPGIEHDAAQQRLLGFD